MRSLPELFFVISGEHPTLPLGELTAVLEASATQFAIKTDAFKYVEVNTQSDVAFEVGKRSGYTDEAGVHVFTCEPTLDGIGRAVNETGLSEFLSKEESFNIRVARYGGVTKEISRVGLEAILGDRIARETSAKVNLTSPDKKFRGIFTGSSFHLGIIEYQRPKASIANRRPRKRPSFHPSTMVPKLARSMVNLSQPRPGDLFLDPFCGVGGILLEACLIGCSGVGMDALPRMVRGTRRNLAHFGLASLGLIEGDARKLPFREVGAIATDPPYGTGASTLKSTTRKILDEFLPQARSILATGRRLVVASPLGTAASQSADDSGFKVLDRHLVYVHRSLTREILVLGAV
ncbi:hypothetical protein E6H36_02700 [Candidatus Bathyarchaeota archaeon]|nr:MAG: hypothetical protein E6H36_02700 [Candidatus Bathyarchaeota archaeon]TMI30995.1 MAG: hypothetical protein E6H29_06200 [Candidatus Bathyarchaeota archaeon]